MVQLGCKLFYGTYNYVVLGMDQHTILGRIGEGAHGIVLKAKHIEVI